MTIIVGKNSTFSWEDNYGNEQEWDGTLNTEKHEISIPFVLEESIADSEAFMKCQDADGGSPKVVVYGDGTISTKKDVFLIVKKITISK